MALLGYRYLTALDIGSSKISCLVAKQASDGSFQIIGRGYAGSAGIKNGVVDDLEKASASIKDAVLMAEKTSDRRIENVIVNISSPQMKSSYAHAQITIPEGRAITAGDVKKVIDTAGASVDLTDMEILHKLPVAYQIDEQKEVTNPVGLHGKTLQVTLLLVSVPLAQLRNLTAALDRLNITVMTRVATPYASACAVLNDDEKQVGTTLIDMGGGLVSVALFGDGFLRYAGALPIGSSLITKDIAQILKTPFIHAERLKTLEGSAFLSPKDTREQISVPLVGSLGETKIPRSHLISIIIPRVDETFELIRAFLKEQENTAFATDKIVLCGGGSLLRGIQEKSTQFLRAQVKLSAPVLPKGIEDGTNWTTFSTCMGLLIYAMNKRIQLEAGKKTWLNNGFLTRIFKWLIQNF